MTLRYVSTQETPVMKIYLACLAVALCFTIGAAHPAVAQTLTNRSFDFELHGDDPGILFTFDLPGSPLTPVMIQFDGFFQNLDLFETGVRYELTWTGATGGEVVGGMDTDFTRLPGSGQVPVSFDHHIGFTPATVRFHVEGGGPGDHLRFVGAFTIQAVPEPGLFVPLGTSAIAGLIWRRSRRTRTHAAS